MIGVELERTQINKFHTKGGTGFAAEEANAMSDRLSGSKVEQVGTDNSLNGADRIVDGIPIQTKYFESASRTVGDAFNEQGVYRYAGQMLEVPSDQYDECVKLMKDKIAQGKVPGVSDPAEAEQIVRKGSVTYRQARNIARAGNIDSLAFDAKQQAVTTTYAFAISFAISFARSKWSGKGTKGAVKEALGVALASGATSFITGVATAQILRTRAAALGAIAMRDGVQVVASTELGRGAVQRLAQASLGKAVYGAAATNHVAKLLRTNVVTSVITTVVISAPDFYRAAFEGSISWAQFSKNLAVNGAGVAGGAGGWAAGAAAGAAIGSAVPGVGTAIGGVLGGVLGALGGGSAATVVAQKLLDGLVVDDAKEMVEQLPKHLDELCREFMLSGVELQRLTDVVKKTVDAPFLRSMYQASNRGAFVRSKFEPECEAIIRDRSPVKMPSEEVVQDMLTSIEDDVLREASREISGGVEPAASDKDAQPRPVGTEAPGVHAAMS